VLGVDPKPEAVGWLAIATGDPTIVQAALSAADQKIVAQYGCASPNIGSPPSSGQTPVDRRHCAGIG